MKIKKYRTFVGDFETTVYKDQTFTEVWASACVELYTEDVKIFHSIDEQFNYFANLDGNICVYYHNLKFDGSFWLSYLLYERKFKQATLKTGTRENDIKWLQDNTMPNNTFKYTISTMGQWYTFVVKVNNKYIEFRDSLKLLPFSLKQIGLSFKTKHQKLDMNYEGFRYAGCEITEDEKKYISNDVLVIKEALEIMFNEGHKKLTIGACCLSEFKSGYNEEEYEQLFPDLSVITLNEKIYGSYDVDSYIRKSYRGGWCYVVKGKENQVKHNGVTADVNSLYPSMMSSESGNYYPVGYPKFWQGNYIPEEAIKNNKYYFVRIKTRFYIKQTKLPFIQIKNTLKYNGNECLTSSDMIDENGNAYIFYMDIDGTIKDTRQTLTLTMSDYKLFLEHYNTVDFEILDGCYFDTKIGLFDNYMNKYKKIKAESKGAKRELAKLFLNNLYGKMASSKDSSFKYAFVREDNSIGFMPVKAEDKKVGYIPIGSAITSYARNFTIRTAQQNFYGADKKGFIYADTDSIHCDISPTELKGVKVHSTDFCCWKLESYWDRAIFTRQKTYIEHITHEDGERIDNPYYNIKCAGMPDKCKKLFNMSLEGYTQDEYNELNETEQEFVKVKRELTDFKVGLKVPSKLLPKRIQGGVVLKDTTYEMR